jgi:hypothetical protein
VPEAAVAKGGWLVARAGASQAGGET